MKKLSSLLTLFSLTLFAVGCGTEETVAPEPDVAPTVEGGSEGPAVDMTDDLDGDADVPPVTDDLPPVTEEPAPVTEEPAPVTDEPAPAEGAEGAAAPALEDAAEGTPSATEAAEATDEATPE